MTAPNAADTGSAGSETPQDGANGTPQGDRPERAGQDLSREGLEAELARARHEAAKFRQRAREFADDEQYTRAKEAVAALDKVENDRKTEVQKLTEDKEGLLNRVSRSEQDLLRLTVALGTPGVPNERIRDFASRLQGDTEEELRADAEQLASFLAPTRRGDPSQGAGNDDDPSSPADSFAALIKSKLNAP